MRLGRVEVPVAHYFIGQRYFGKATVHPQSRSTAFFCRTCAEIWARVMVDDAKDCDLFQNACEKHSNHEIWTRNQPPGSIIPTIYIDAIDAAAGSPLLLHNLPRELLLREFLLTAKDLP